MRIRLNEQRCELHGECTIAAPEVFAIRDEDNDDHVTLLMHDIPAELQDEVRLAEEQCPVQAIEFDEE